ncbi:protein ARV1 [Chironomus tepperi]|uniref:protein ARV1 n=1 Tax=Chironomus tepperi TaxID=113505 RepID=UPI00391FB6A8
MELLRSKIKTLSAKPQAEELTYCCVNCGYPVKELYHVYSPTVQKLTECKNCSLLADPFIEYDNLYIIINLILLSTKVQRHVLYNSSCKGLYKILMIITIVESYFLWNELSENKKNYFTTNESIKDPLFMEKGFYLSTLQIVLSNLSFFIIIRVISMWTPGILYTNRSLTLDLFHGYMLASVAKFFFLPIIIWNENISGVNRVIHLFLVVCYFLISLIYVHSNVCGTSKKISAAVILLAFIINKYIWFNLNFTGIA